jgi:hypothetical protein
MNGKDAWEEISKGINDDVIRDNLQLNYKINEQKRYIAYLEAKTAVLEQGFRDLGKSINGMDINLNK